MDLEFRRGGVDRMNNTCRLKDNIIACTSGS